jgi:ABC-type glycerol-3-phosphate transport system permease component
MAVFPAKLEAVGRKMLTFQLSSRWQRHIQRLVSYVVLFTGGAFILFPVAWMLSASLKPNWQIFTHPIIWIPQEWLSADTGPTVQLTRLWTVKDYGQDVIKLDTRLYTTVIPASSLPDLQVVPTNEMSSATQKTRGGVTLNVRDWHGQAVVALRAEGDDALLVVPYDQLNDLMAMPEDRLNSGERGERQAGSYAVETRRVEVDGQSVELVNLGPKFRWHVVAPADALASAIQVPADDVSQRWELLPLGDTETRQYTLASADPDTRYALLDQSPWQPAVPERVIQERAFVVGLDDVAIEAEPGVFNQAQLTVGRYAPEGGVPGQVVILKQSEDQSRALVIAAADVREVVELVPSKAILRPYPEKFDGFPIFVKDFSLITSDEPSIRIDEIGQRIALLGEQQNMALLIPSDALTGAFEVPEAALARKTRPRLRFENYKLAMQREFSGVGFPTFFKNSAIIAGLAIVGHLLSCTVVGYGFARLRAPGRGLLFGILLATMMLPYQVTLIPVYEIFRDLGMIDTLWPMFITAFFGNAFFVFLMRQFFRTIPAELEDAARIDGANRLQVFLRIMLPLTMPAQATIAIFTFLGRWNDLFGALIYLNSPKHYTVAIGLSAFNGQYTSEFNLLMAATVIVMLPTVMLFFFAQRFFIEGITLTGLKG